MKSPVIRAFLFYTLRESIHMLQTSRRQIYIRTETLQSLLDVYKSMGRSLIPLVSCLSDASRMASKLSRMAMDLESRFRTFRSNLSESQLDALEDLNQSVTRLLIKDLQMLAQTLPALHRDAIKTSASLSQYLDQVRRESEANSEVSIKPKPSEYGDSSSVEAEPDMPTYEPLDDILYGEP